MSRLNRMEPIAFDLAVPGDCPVMNPVLCLECRRSVIPTSRFHCPDCKISCYFGWDRVLCQCGEWRGAARRGYKLAQPACDCQLSIEKREKLERDMARKRAEQQEQEIKQATKEAARSNATNCWKNKKEECDVILSRPIHKFCYACPKFKRGPELRTASPTENRGYRPPLQHVPMQDLDDTDAA